MIDFNQQQQEAAAIRKDMQKAYEIIRDSKARYIKAKLKARSKTQAAMEELLFADLAHYESKQEIIDAYGWAAFTGREYERLLNLWDQREQHTKNNGKYRDRVIDMLDKAVAHIGDEYQDFLHEADEVARENEKNQRGRFPVVEDSQ